MDVFGKSKEGKEDEEEKRLMWVPNVGYSRIIGERSRAIRQTGGALIGEG